MSAKPILQEKIPQRFEGRNIRTPKRSGAKDDLYLVQFEITREAWEALETVPKSALLEGVIWFHFGDPEKNESIQPEAAKKKEKKEKAAKGEHGQYWHEMFDSTFYNNVALKVHLRLDISATSLDVKNALYKVFNVTSMSYVSQEQFEEWASKNELSSIITASRLAASRVADAAARKAKA